VSEVSHRALPELLAEIKAGTVCPVYLLYGDDFICRAAFKSVLDELVPPKHQDLNYEPIDGADENVYEIVQHLNTFPMIPSAKVIAIHGTRVFYSDMAMDVLFGKSREAFERQDIKKSAQYLLYILSMAEMSLDDIREGNWKKSSNKTLREHFEMEEKKDDDGGWLAQVITYCLHENMAVPDQQDDADVLNDAIISGYPTTNHLILITDLVDKRRRLYKTIKKVGVVIDCSVPKGNRSADKRQQQEALKSHMKRILKKVGKTMAPGGFESLYEKIGTDMRSFNSELEKVVTFVGDRDEILPADIEKISKRTKQDPIYEMSNAIAERDTHKALFFLDSLLRSRVHQLQVLAVVTNQIRKLVLAKDFIRSKPGGNWRKDLSFGGFKKMILPEIEKRDPDSLTDNAHPYAIYMTLKQSHNFTLAELVRTLELLLDTDIRLKSSGQNAKVVLENAVINMCAAPKIRAPGES
jgi:DNA polymerase-3 subunit delta